jgi:hypothetical protein
MKQKHFLIYCVFFIGVAVAAFANDTGHTTFRLWSGPAIPSDPNKIPFAKGVEHQTILDAREHDYKFLHGAAIINSKGTFFANWANSPLHENGPRETLQGRRSTDGCATWSDKESSR